MADANAVGDVLDVLAIMRAEQLAAKPAASKEEPPAGDWLDAAAAEEEADPSPAADDFNPFLDEAPPSPPPRVRVDDPGKDMQPAGDVSELQPPPAKPKRRSSFQQSLQKNMAKAGEPTWQACVFAHQVTATGSSQSLTGNRAAFSQWPARFLRRTLHPRSSSRPAHRRRRRKTRVQPWPTFSSHTRSFVAPQR